MPNAAEGLDLAFEDASPLHVEHGLRAVRDQRQELRLEARREDDRRRRVRAGEQEAALVGLQLGHADQTVDLVQRHDAVLDAAGAAGLAHARGACRAWRRWRRGAAGSRRSPGGSPRPPAPRGRRSDRSWARRPAAPARVPGASRTAAARRSPAPSSGRGRRRRRPRRRRARARIASSSPRPAISASVRAMTMKSREPTRRARRLDLAGVLLGRHEVAPHAGVEAAALRELVVLDADARGAGALELARPCA